jgi:hypothetical protein
VPATHQPIVTVSPGSNTLEEQPDGSFTAKFITSGTFVTGS